MPRVRKTRHDLPSRVYCRRGSYFFVRSDGKWINLGRNYAPAMAAWAELLQPPVSARTMNDLFDRYALQVIPHKAPRTQRDNHGELRYLRSYFGEMPPELVQPSHIASYRDARSAKTRGNRELALLSHVFSKAAEWGVIKANPCREVARNKERARDRYITDEEIAAFRECASPWLRAYVDIKNITGLRQQDILALRREHADREGILVWIHKTKQWLKMTWTEELRTSLDSLPNRGATYFATRTGEQCAASGFGSIWKRAMAKYLSLGNSRFHEHDIRGKVATDAEAAGRDAQPMLAHKSRAMTERYVKAKAIPRIEPLRRNS